jgi:hypothetical protein
MKSVAPQTPGRVARRPTLRSALLEGNGAGFVRERAVAAAVQRALERLYQIDDSCDVGAFLEPARDGEREAVFLREASDGSLEVSVRIPKLARRAFDVARDADLDPLCQLIEGVSHFVYIAERARAGREATQLELEVQAEIDKYVVLAASLRDLDRARSEKLRERLYEVVSFGDAHDTDAGERYRVANDVARRYVRMLEREFVAARRFRELRAELRRFYWMGQEEKLRVGRAA